MLILILIIGNNVSKLRYCLLFYYNIATKVIALLKVIVYLVN